MSVLFEAPTNLSFAQKGAPESHPAVGRQPLVSKADPDGLLRMRCVNFDHRLVRAACVWLSWFLHTKHSFNPRHHQTPSESFRPGERGLP